MSSARAKKKMENDERRTLSREVNEEGAGAAAGAAAARSPSSSLSPAARAAQTEALMEQKRAELKAGEDSHEVVLDDMSAALDRLGAISNDIHIELGQHK